MTPFPHPQAHYTVVCGRTQPPLHSLVLLKSFDFLQSFPLTEETWRYRGSKRKTSQEICMCLCIHLIMYSRDKQTKPNSLHSGGMSWPQQETTGWFEGCISQHYWALSYHLCRLQHISCLGTLHSPGASSSSPWVRLCASGSPGDCSVPLQRKMTHLWTTALAASGAYHL